VGLTARTGERVRRTVVRATLVAVAAGLMVAGAASGAAAHTRAQAATDFSSTIDAAPELAGVHWRVYAGGEFLELTNSSPTDVIVAGYEGEPYLRVGPDGVFSNRNSPAAYLNSERYGDVALPPRADAAAPADWVQVSAGTSHAWHDHRIHWMALEPPPAVTAAPGQHHEISQWSVPLTYDGAEHTVNGTLEWVPGTPWWPWAIAGLLLGVPALLGVVAGWEHPRLVRPAAATVAAVAAFNSIHFVDELLAWPAPTLDVLFGLLHTSLFVGAGLAGAAVAWRGRYGPLLSLGIGSAAVLFHQGLLQLPVLWASQLPTVWPEAVLRIAVAASVGQAIWVAVVIASGLRAGGVPAATAAEAATPPATELPELHPRTRSTV
jgi:hypothetical protein